MSRKNSRLVTPVFTRYFEKKFDESGIQASSSESSEEYDEDGDDDGTYEEIDLEAAVKAFHRIVAQQSKVVNDSYLLHQTSKKEKNVRTVYMTQLSDLSSKNADALVAEEEKNRQKAKKKKEKKKKCKERKKEIKENDNTSSKTSRSGSWCNGDTASTPSKDSDRSNKSQNASKPACANSDENHNVGNGDGDDEDEAFLDPNSAFVSKAVNKNKHKVSSSISRMEQTSNVGSRKTAGMHDSAVGEGERVVREGYALASKEQYAEAVTCFSKAIRLVNNDHRFYSNRSFCYCQLEQYSKCTDLLPGDSRVISHNALQSGTFKMFKIIKEFCNETVFSNYGSYLSQPQMNVLWSVIVSIFLMGGVTGSLTGGWVADGFGRKGAVVISGMLSLVAALFFVTCHFAQSVEMLLLARLVIGLSCGLTTSTIPMYLTEIAPLSIGGAMGVLCPQGLTVGVIVAQVLGLKQVLGRPDTWPYLLGLYAALILVSALALPFLPESPKYLYIVRGQEERGIRELTRLRGLAPDELEDMRQANKAEEEAGGSWTFGSVLRAPSLRLPLLLVCAVQAGQQFSGINAVFYYSMTIFENAGLSHDGAGGMNLLVAIIAIPLVNRCGRRPLALWSCFTASVCLVLLCVCITYIKSFTWMPYVAIFAVLAYVFCYGYGLGPIPYFIGSEERRRKNLLQQLNVHRANDLTPKARHLYDKSKYYKTRTAVLSKKLLSIS